MAILSTGKHVGRYLVQSLIKENLYTETYRVEDENHNPFFLKAYLTKKMPEKMINQETGVVYEIEHVQNLKHKNLISFIESGTMHHEEGSIQLVDSRRRVVALGSDWDKDIKPAIDRMVK